LLERLIFIQLFSAVTQQDHWVEQISPGFQPGDILLSKIDTEMYTIPLGHQFVKKLAET